MRKLFLGSALLVASSLGTAFAADLGIAPGAVPAYTNWSGCYVGASAGTSSGHSSGFSTTPSTLALGFASVAGGFPITNSFNLSGFIGGFQGGCNYQVGAWVWGFEVDGSATNKSGQTFGNGTTTPTSIGPLPTNPGVIYELQERWLTTARGRLGWTIWNNAMIYVTGGGAWAKIDASEWLAGFPAITGVQQSVWRSGWTVGGGLEYALGYGWSVKSEYLYVDFGDFNTITGCPSVGLGCPAGAATNLNVNLKDHIFRAGMNYKFW
jgi:outer membrane immunogenic protein